MSAPPPTSPLGKVPEPPLWGRRPHRCRHVCPTARWPHSSAPQPGPSGRQRPGLPPAHAQGRPADASAGGKAVASPGTDTGTRRPRPRKQTRRCPGTRGTTRGGPPGARAGSRCPSPRPDRHPGPTGPAAARPHAAPAPRPTSDAAHTRRVHTTREHHGALPAASFPTAPAGPGRAAERGCQGGGRPRSREDGERPRGPAPPWTAPRPRPAAQGPRRPPPPGPTPPPPPAMESPARAGRPGLGTAPRRPRLTRLEPGARAEADPTCGSRRRPLSARRRRRPPPPTVTGRAPTVIPPRIPPRRDFAPDAGPQRTPALLLPQSRAARRPLGVCRGLPRVGDCGTRAEVGTALFFWADGH